MSQPNDDIDGELVDDNQAAGTEPARQQQVAPYQRPQAPASFNPLGADPQALAESMERHQTNRVALREWLLANLEPGRDFGAIHTMPKDRCPRPYDCTDPYHFSEDSLFDPGAETVRTILGLGARYPGIEEYRQASLKGVQIVEVICTCELVDGHGRVVAEGTGAATVKECKGSLHNALAKAQKRARVAAVRELPTVRTLFKGSKTLPDGRQYGSTESPTASDMRRSERQRPQRDDRAPERKRPPVSGKVLETMPFGKHKGVPFTQLDGRYLAWCLENMDHVDVVHTAKVELDRRRLQAAADDAAPPATESRQSESDPARSGHVDLPSDDDGFDDDGPPPDAYFR